MKDGETVGWVICNRRDPVGSGSWLVLFASAEVMLRK